MQQHVRSRFRSGNVTNADDQLETVAETEVCQQGGDRHAPVGRHGGPVPRTQPVQRLVERGDGAEKREEGPVVGLQSDAMRLGHPGRIPTKEPFHDLRRREAVRVIAALVVQRRLPEALEDRVVVGHVRLEGIEENTVAIEDDQ